MLNRNLRKILLYIPFAFIISWAFYYIYVALGGKMDSPFAAVMMVFYMYGPFLAALIVTKYIFKENFRDLGISFKFNPWFIAASIIPVLVALATFFVSLKFNGITYSPDMAGMFARYSQSLTPEQTARLKDQLTSGRVPVVWILVLQTFILGATVNAIAAFGEETGWRGLFLKEANYLGFWKGSFLIGIIWGLWHAPLILAGHNFPQHPKDGVLMMTAFCMLLSPLICYIALKAKSIIASSIMHGTINAAAGLSIMFLAGGDDLTVGLTGSAGLITLLGFNVLLFLWNNIITKRAERL